MKKILIVTIVLILIGVGAWFLFGSGKGSGEEDASTGEGLSLTEVLNKAKDVVSYRYEALITAPGQSPITAKFWLKGNKMRWEGNYERQNVVLLIDQGEQVSYVYIPAQSIAMKMDFSKSKGTVGESPTEQSESVMDHNPVTLGTETLDGKTCLIVEYTSEAGKTKMWFWTRYGIPIRTESTTTQGTTVVELKNMDFGDISDSMFELPAGVQLMTIPSFGF